MSVDEIGHLIDDQLRFILFGLECALNVEFNPAEVERLFDDAERDPARGGEYIFWQGRGLSVTGHVDTYEPYGMDLRVESRRPVVPSLSEIVERAQYQVYRIERRREAEYEEVTEC